MAVLTLSRQIGSNGAYIGRKISKDLGYHFADKQVIQAVFSRYGFAPFEKIYETPISFWDRFDRVRKNTLQNLNSVIEALARHGNMVILGRGSFAVLGGLADILNVRIQAPFSYRVEQVMEKENMKDREKAEMFLEEQSLVRTEFVETTYQVAWDAASNFDLVINTSQVPPDMAANWLVQILKAMDQRQIPVEASTKSFEVDSAMAKSVSEVLDCWNTH